MCHGWGPCHSGSAGLKVACGCAHTARIHAHCWPRKDWPQPSSRSCPPKLWVLLAARPSGRPSKNSFNPDIAGLPCENCLCKESLLKKNSTPKSPYAIRLPAGEENVTLLPDSSSSPSLQILLRHLPPAPPASPPISSFVALRLDRRAPCQKLQRPDMLMDAPVKPEHDAGWHQRPKAPHENDPEHR